MLADQRGSAMPMKPISYSYKPFGKAMTEQPIFAHGHSSNRNPHLCFQLVRQVAGSSLPLGAMLLADDSPRLADLLAGLAAAAP